MKDIGLIFSTEMVQAILDSRKTQTRRTRGLEEINKEPDRWKLDAILNDGTYCFLPKLSTNPAEVQFIKCPYQVGDRIWVRETFHHYGNHYNSGKASALVTYKADNLNAEIPFDTEPPTEKWWNTGKPINYMQSSRFMPKKFARIWLPITNVGCERLQEISLQDIQREGITQGAGGGLDWTVEAVNDFKYLWDSLNAKYSWDYNPWVFIPEWKPYKEE